MDSSAVPNHWHWLLIDEQSILFETRCDAHQVYKWRFVSFIP